MRVQTSDKANVSRSSLIEKGRCLDFRIFAKEKIYTKCALPEKKPEKL